MKNNKIETNGIETKLEILALISRRNSLRCVLEQEWSGGGDVPEVMAYDVGFRK